jgi:UDP-N-acetylglucosamine 2-epimerase (non-hydrolysing)
MQISIIAGARPNFMKIAPIIDAIKIAQSTGKSISFRLVHTGQHFDHKMSESFFQELGIPEPDVNLACGGGTQAEQTAAIMVKFEKELIEHPADVVLVVGDVTSTMACSIVAKKLNIQVVHVEAGIRSFDLSMPEEINRMVTDALADHFFTTSEKANQNLLLAGNSNDRIHFVGNTMIDTLLKQKSRFKKPEFWDELGLEKNEYLVLTLHRPANVDDPEKLKELLVEIIANANQLPVVFPVHPRTAKMLEQIQFSHVQLKTVEPQSYLAFNFMVMHAKGVITDSGGITEETTVMGIPCMTLRDNTERPETVSIGTNELIGTNPKAIQPALQNLLSGNWKKGAIPPLWDGKASERIVAKLLSIYHS